MSRTLDRLAGNLGRWLITYAARHSNMVAHVEREWSILFDEPDEMQDAVKSSVLGCVSMFSLDGHSGFSAEYTTGLIERAMKFEPFGPLTGADNEWTDVGSITGGPTIYQNKRDSRVFKDDEAGAYFIEGKIFRETDGVCYVSSKSHVPVTFPYSPVSDYVDVDEDGNELPNPNKLDFEEIAILYGQEVVVTFINPEDAGKFFAETNARR